MKVKLPRISHMVEAIWDFMNMNPDKNSYWRVVASSMVWVILVIICMAVAILATVVAVLMLYPVLGIRVLAVVATILIIGMFIALVRKWGTV